MREIKYHAYLDSEESRILGRDCLCDHRWGR